NVAHAVLVTSTVARGKISRIDAAAAEKAPGVIAVISHRNAPRVDFPEKARASVDPEVGRPLPPLQDDVVHYHGQPIAVVVANTLDRATPAASLARLSYREERAVTTSAAAARKASPPTEPKSSDRGTKKASDYHRGEPDRALADADVRIEQTYTIPTE